MPLDEDSLSSGVQVPLFRVNLPECNFTKS
uniref:Uncharacterized protein n=1 Tax=Anguilla anguilla TaxID=7936 RepID=A0A0E9VCL5_ANGAN